MTTAKYFAFGGDRYYPGGGAEDLIGVFESLGVAFRACDLAAFEWMHVAVLDNGDFNILAEWSDNFSYASGHWWRVGEYPNATYAKKWTGLIVFREADNA